MVDRKQQFTSFLYGKPLQRWAFYILIFFLAMMTLYDVTSLTLEYVGNPKQANMNVKFNNSMKFPNITFCMPRRQAWSHFGVNIGDKTSMEKVEQWGPNIEKELGTLENHTNFMSSQWPPELIMSAYQAIATLNGLERESVAQQAVKDINRFAKSGKKLRLRTLVKKWVEAIDKRNVTFADFTNKVGLEVLRRSIIVFMRQSQNDSDNFHMKTSVNWLSNTHLCFRPVFLDEESFKPIEDQGDFFLMVLKQNEKMSPNESNSDCISVDFHGRPTTTVRNMQGKGRVKDGIGERLCSGQMHELTAEIRAHYQMLENDESATACRLYDDEESKSEFDCRLRCRMKMIREICHCTPQTLRYLSDDQSAEQYPLCDYEKCDISESQQNVTDQKCAQSCVPHCVQVRYTLNHDQQRAKNPAVTSVKLIWGAFEYLELEQSYVWSLWTFIAAIGGSIGMWLGLSMLSFIQLIVFVTDRTAHKVTVVKKKKDTVATGHEPPPHYSSNPAQFASQNAIRPSHAAKVSDSGERKGSASMNPFGGPVAVNIFESPFPQKNKTSQA